MRADSLTAVLKVAEFAGVDLEPRQLEQFELFHTFLHDEAIKAGGIGPNEGTRLWRRHIADAVVFSLGFGPAENCLDVGTGVGLPGIPLAIVFPNTEFTLLDRAGRRADLARRAGAILELDNTTVVQADIADLDGKYHRIVSRASLPPEQLMIHVKHQLRSPDGIAIIGLSHGAITPPEAVETAGYRSSVLRIPGKVLDTTPSLLRIEAT